MTSARFDLLETMRWDPHEGFVLLERHLARLRESASAFRWSCDLQIARDALSAGVRLSDQRLRVRLLMSADGSVRVETAPLDQMPSPLRVGIAAAPIDSSDPMLCHKTTDRGRYDRLRRGDVDDVILWNEQRQATESTIANLVIEQGNRRVTPPLACGLLPGTLRAELVARGEIVESIVTVDELATAARIWLVNSVRGWCPATIVSPAREVARRPDSL